MLSSDTSVSHIKNATSPIVTVQKDGDSGNISTGSQTPSLQIAEQSSTFLHNISITGGPPSPTQNSICPFHIFTSRDETASFDKCQAFYKLLKITHRHLASAFCP